MKHLSLMSDRIASTVSTSNYGRKLLRHSDILSTSLAYPKEAVRADGPLRSLSLWFGNVGSLEEVCII